MKRIIPFALLLTAGLTASAWLGMNDARDRAAKGAVQLNNPRKRPILNEGEILVWSPDMQTPPPNTPASPSDLKAGQVYRAIPMPESSPQPTRTIRPREVPASVQGPEIHNYHAAHSYRDTRKLIPVAKPLGAPRAGEWRAKINEPEQDFGQFLNNAPLVSGSIVIQPIGDLPIDQKKAIGHLMDALSAFYGLPAVCATPIPLSRLPNQCFSNAGGFRLLNAEAVMRLVLYPLLGGEVGFIIAITAVNIHPGGNWPFESVFGRSSFDSGTAIISTARILDRSEAYRGRNLLRMTKLGIHELAHTFGMENCGKYQCLLNGSGSVKEYDAKPLSLCPDCLAKLSLSTGRKPSLHLEDMLGLCQAKGFSGEARYYQNALRILTR